MKKIAVLGFMFFMIFSQSFADENTNEHENISFSWQLFYAENTNQEISFLNINPLFFNFNNDYLLLRLYNNNMQNNSLQNGQYINSKENDIKGFIGLLLSFSGMFFAYSHMNRQEWEIYHDAWRQQNSIEQMHQRFIRYSNRN